MFTAAYLSVGVLCLGAAFVVRGAYARSWRWWYAGMVLLLVGLAAAGVAAFLSAYPPAG